jgi:hypothetical protein
MQLIIQQVIGNESGNFYIDNINQKSKSIFQME